MCRGADTLTLLVALLACRFGRLLFREGGVREVELRDERDRPLRAEIGADAALQAGLLAEAQLGLVRVVELEHRRNRVDS